MKKYNFLAVALIGTMMVTGSSFGMESADVGLQRLENVYKNRVMNFVQNKLRMVSKYPQMKVGPAPILNDAIKTIVEPTDYFNYKDKVLNIVLKSFNEAVDAYSSDPSFRARFHANGSMIKIPAALSWYTPF